MIKYFDAKVMSMFWTAKLLVPSIKVPICGGSVQKIFRDDSVSTPLVLYHRFQHRGLTKSFEDVTN